MHIDVYCLHGSILMHMDSVWVHKCPSGVATNTAAENKQTFSLNRDMNTQIVQARKHKHKHSPHPIKHHTNTCSGASYDDHI